eukprot:7818346-Pyramimonas_sp.AAC.1
MHAFTVDCQNRIVGKLVHLHICKGWNMPEGPQRQRRLPAVPEVPCTKHVGRSTTYVWRACLPYSPCRVHSIPGRQ